MSTVPVNYEKSKVLDDIIEQGKKILTCSCKGIFVLEEYVRESLKVLKKLTGEL